MITLILAHDAAGGIGLKNGLPWPRIKEDMKRFREATVDHQIVMGRKTFDSIGGKPLPKRTNCVITRNPQAINGSGALIYGSVIELMNHAADVETFVIGGAQIYEQSMPYATRILLTRVIGTFEADIFWKPDLTGWDLVSKEEGIEDNKVVCLFEEYKRDAPEMTL